MAMAVIFSGIARVVLPLGVGRDRTIPKRLRILADAMLILNDHDGCGRMLDEHRDYPISQAAALDRLSHLSRNVFDMPFALHLKAKGYRRYRHTIIPRGASAGRKVLFEKAGPAAPPPRWNRTPLRTLDCSTS